MCLYTFLQLTSISRPKVLDFGAQQTRCFPLPFLRATPHTSYLQHSLPPHQSTPPFHDPDKLQLLDSLSFLLPRICLFLSPINSHHPLNFLSELYIFILIIAHIRELYVFNVVFVDCILFPCPILHLHRNELPCLCGRTCLIHLFCSSQCLPQGLARRRTSMNPC